MQEKQSPISVDSTPIRSDTAGIDGSLIDPNLQDSIENPIEKDHIEKDPTEVPIEEDLVDEQLAGTLNVDHI